MNAEALLLFAPLLLSLLLVLLESLLVVTGFVAGDVFTGAVTVAVGMVEVFEVLDAAIVVVAPLGPTLVLEALVCGAGGKAATDR